ncbi:hypothetical protein Tsubulata_032642 [Turnera subulata]|uniref:Auxin response factor n=1 Tax=Turnera subulata TaxID=218843 RepID=A0A9Q0JQK6_9ROSI|nr:hypothetical protein Tsubulata_032642 [Turnera subulata]
MDAQDFEEDDALYVELWKASAGESVHIPRPGERVFFDMQQMETSSNDQEPNQRIQCRVILTQLLAEQETDEVYLKITVLQESDETESARPPASADSRPPEPERPAFHSFSKILTAADTSTYGGFSVLRRYAIDCLPPLDTSQPFPSQELVAKDIHGLQWRFRHVFRGRPRRHLLTSGWSTFVASKRLVAGDTLVVLRGENGELRVGARRQRSNTPSSLFINNQIIQSGEPAREPHSASAQTPFVVYYKPWTNQLILSLSNCLEDVKNTVTVGVRFNIRFEGNGSDPGRRLSGTIVGVEDFSHWTGSKRRSLTVKWDESSSSSRT